MIFATCLTRFSASVIPTMVLESVTPMIRTPPRRFAKAATSSANWIAPNSLSLAGIRQTLSNSFASQTSFSAGCGTEQTGPRHRGSTTGPRGGSRGPQQFVDRHRDRGVLPFFRMFLHEVGPRIGQRNIVSMANPHREFASDNSLSLV